MRKLLLDFPVIVYLPFLSVNHQHLSGLQSSFLYHFGGVEVHYTDLAGYGDESIVGNGVTGRTKTIPIQHSACVSAVAEYKSRRAVPWFHEDGVVFVEVFQFLTDRIPVIETLRDEYCHGLWQAHTAHDKKFQHVVQRCGVAHSRLYDGENLLHVA